MLSCPYYYLSQKLEATLGNQKKREAKEFGI